MNELIASMQHRHTSGRFLTGRSLHPIVFREQRSPIWNALLPPCKVRVREPAVPISTCPPLGETRTREAPWKRGDSSEHAWKGKMCRKNKLTLAHA